MQLRATRAGAIGNRRQTALTLSQLLPAGAGRVAAIYSDPARPSYDECIAKNMAALGPELVVNGDFSGGLAGWTLVGTSAPTGLAVSDGVEITGTGGGYQGLRKFQDGITAGKTYRVSITASRLTASSQLVVSGPFNPSATFSETWRTTKTVAVVATSNKVEVLIDSAACTGAFKVHNISVREIDLSMCVLFSDAAGQTPVVYPIGAGQGKGLLLDRSAGLVRGAELIANGDFSGGSASWILGAGVTVSGGVASSNGTIAAAASVLTQDTFPTANRLFECIATVTVTAGSLNFRPGGANGPTISTSGTVRQLVQAGSADAFRIIAGASGFTGTIDNVSVREIPGHHQQQPTAAARGEFSRRYNQLLATATLATQSFTAIAAQYRLYFTGAGTVTLSGAATGAYSAGSHLITCTAGSLTLTVAGSVLTADCRFEADASIGLQAYQRVTTASDYDETGFPTYWRAVTDDWAKSRMNPNGATKVYAIWTGQKMLESISGILVETSANSDGALGAMRLVAPSTAGAFSASFGIKGAASTVTAYTDPVTQLQTPKRLVLQGYASVLEDVVQLKANSTTVAVSTDLGAVSCTEQDVFFGARAGTSLFANFREYAPPLILFLQPADSLSASYLGKLQRAYAKAAGVTL